MAFSEVFCTFFACAAMLMDVRMEKVPNGWILLGWGAGAVYRLMQSGPAGLGIFLLCAAAPLGVLFPLFAGRMLGTGDLKVFSVLAVFLGIREILRCMVWSFLAAGVLSVPVLIFRCGVRERFSYFLQYLEAYAATGQWKPYLRPGPYPENIHFTIPVFIGLFLSTGGVV